MKRAASIVIAVLAAACGTGERPASDRRASEAPTPAATTAVGAEPVEASARPDASPAASADPARTAGRPAGRTPPPPPPGRYTYAAEGRGESPQGDVSSSSTVSVDVSRAGSTRVRVETRPNARTRTTEELAWTPTGVSLSREIIRVEGLPDRDCRYTPPLVLVRFPLERGSYPVQRWDEGGTCRGSLDVAVRGSTGIEEAGRRWAVTILERTWTTRFSADNNVRTTETIWFSPETGIDVRTRTVQDSAVGGRRFSSDSTWRLRSFPNR